MNTIGRRFRLTIVGESHGELVGVVLDGVPPGVPFGEADVQPALDRRRPGQSLLTTQRAEADRVRIRSGVHEGRTTGAPLLLEILNEDKRSQDYAELRHKPRPGHADHTASVHYLGHNDPRGSGHFSGRMTAAWVMAGALAQKVLAAHGIQGAAHAVRIGGVETTSQLAVRPIREAVEKTPVRCADLAQADAMIAAIEQARKAGDSVGGIVECVYEGLPEGLGDPILDSAEALLTHALFGIPAVKGVEFGSGFALAAMRGSEARDEFVMEEGALRTRANHNGGILGGITTGMPVRFRVAFKPTSSIPLSQQTVDLRTGEPAELRVKGRHDPCIVPRAVPVVEAVAACVLLDLLLERHGVLGVAAPFQEAR
ncbi:MAG TPA: chorismate synthase [Candidatus Thermoplasmatota archaeon]|nr:chorismate synthase [Candidatus Thermoplasmatota archaeon]